MHPLMSSRSHLYTMLGFPCTMRYLQWTSMSLISGHFKVIPLKLVIKTSWKIIIQRTNSVIKSILSATFPFNNIDTFLLRSFHPVFIKSQNPTSLPNHSVFSFASFKVLFLHFTLPSVSTQKSYNSVFLFYPTQKQSFHSFSQIFIISFNVITSKDLNWTLTSVYICTFLPGCVPAT
jgi:hypothetical protein